MHEPKNQRPIDRRLYDPGRDRRREHIRDLAVGLKRGAFGDSLGARRDGPCAAKATPDLPRSYPVARAARPMKRQCGGCTLCCKLLPMKSDPRSREEIAELMAGLILKGFA